MEKDKKTSKAFQNRIAQLDGIRGIAIILVLINHYYNNVPTSNSEIHQVLKKVFSQSWNGVDLFFVLSGFLIGSILMKQKYSMSYFKTFFVRRACRILPLYLLLLCSFMIGSYFIVDNSILGKSLIKFHYPIWSYFLFIQNFFISKWQSFGGNWLGITWSLSIEEQFYLLFPFLIRYIPNRIIPYVLFSVILVSPLFRCYLVFNTPFRGGMGPYVLLPSRMDALLVGAFGAWLIKDIDIKKQLEENIYFLYVIFMIFGVGLYLFSMNELQYNSGFNMTMGYSWNAGFYLSFILIAVLTTNRLLLNFLTFKPLRMLGFISYFCYLFHQLINYCSHYYIAGTTPNLSSNQGMIATFLSLLVLFFMGGISWAIFEKPIIKLGRKFEY